MLNFFIKKTYVKSINEKNKSINKNKNFLLLLIL